MGVGGYANLDRGAGLLSFYANFIGGVCANVRGEYVLRSCGTDMMGICNFEKTGESRNKPGWMTKSGKKFEYVGLYWMVIDI